MKKTSLEFRVGVFVFMSLAILTIFVVKAGDFYVKPGYTVRFIFDFVTGLDRGSPVRLAGVNVGEIKEIRVVRNLEGETHVEVIAWISAAAKIEEDAEVRINALGLLGEKYVEVLPGTKGARTLTAGSTMIGKAPIVIEKITETGNRLINKLEHTVDNINEVVTDPQFKASVSGTFKNANSAFGNVDAVSKNLVSASEDLKDAAHSARIVLARLRDGEGTVGRLFKDDTLARDLEDFVKDIKAHPWKLLKKS